MTPAVELRPATTEEAKPLSDLAFRSKGYWSYDEEFLESCRQELTLSADELVDRRTTVAAAGETIVGFYTLEGTPPRMECGMLFVEPRWIGRGVGRLLWNDLVATATRLGATTVELAADPNAEAFYVALGAGRVGSVPSGSIAGRHLPLLRYDLA